MKIVSLILQAVWTLLILFSGMAAGQEDWSQFRGPGGQGVSQGKDLPVTWSDTENLVWKTELPGAGGSAPILLGDRIFLTSYSGYAVTGGSRGALEDLQRHVLCLQRKDGKLLWKKDLPAVQPEEAKVRDHGYASSTPAADRERIYVFLGKSGVFAFSPDGKEVWRTSVGTQTHGWGSASSPVIYKDLLIVNAAVESGALVALNKATGKEVWRHEGMKESWNTPIIVPRAGGKDELVVAIFGKVLGLNPLTGEQLWSCATDIGWYMVPSLVYAKDIVYCIGGRSGGSLAIKTGGQGDVTGSNRLWTTNKGSNVSSPLYHNGHLYFLHENSGTAYCLEAASGKVVYQESLPRAGQFYASPVLVEGRIYCPTRNGEVFIWAASPNFELLGRNRFSDRSTFDASPAVDGSRLLIRSDKFLYCMGKM